MMCNKQNRFQAYLEHSQDGDLWSEALGASIILSSLLLEYNDLMIHSLAQQTNRFSFIQTIPFFKKKKKTKGTPKPTLSALLS